MFYPLAYFDRLPYNNFVLSFIYAFSIKNHGKESCFAMKLLEDKIKSCGRVLPGNVLKVDGFLNHCIDVPFISELGKEFKNRYSDCEVNKILTIEASGIGIACLTAQFFNCPVVFAKKSKTNNISDDVYQSSVESFTHKTVNTVLVSKEFLNADDRILIIDDFLANGCALLGLIDIVKQSGATLVGAGIVIEKAFQPGGETVRNMGIRVESLARIKSMTDNSLEFVEE